MKRFLTQTTLVATLATCGFAQGSQTASALAPEAQTFRGILMDASCPAIQNQTSRTQSISSTTPSSNMTEPTARAVQQSSAVAASTGIGGSTAGAASGAGASGSLNNTTNSGGTAATRNTAAATTGTNQSHEGNATAQAGSTPPTDARSTATASGTTASGSSSVTTYSGKTSAAANNAASSGSGERSRSADETGAGMDWANVREKYAACKVNANTSAFALMTNGRVHLVDDTTGSLRQKMVSFTAGVPDWHSVTLTGNMQSDRINVASVQ